MDAKFDFNKAARKVVKDHPALRGHALYIDVSKDSFGVLEQALLRLDADEDDIDELRKSFNEAKRRKTSFHQEISVGKKSIDVMLLHPDRHPVFGDKPGAKDDAGTFDHETGHALSINLSGTLAENTADAYASLRHLQRFGGDTTDLEYAGWKRAAVFMLTGKTSHLTTPSIDKIVLDSKSADFLSLSPADTIKLAKSYAEKQTPTASECSSLAKQFKSVKGLPPGKAFKKIAAITLKADEKSDAFYLGARVLKGALKEGGMVLDGKKISLYGRDWQRIEEKLDKKISRLPARHFLRRAA